MLLLALALLAAACVAAVFGYGLLGGVTYDAAKVLFFTLLVLAVMTFIADAFRDPMLDTV